jgi:hypothetical protein
MDKFIVLTLMLCVGCASTGAPSGDPCKQRGFDEWVAFYNLMDQAESSWNEDYKHAFRWLEDVAAACYPERFETEGEEDGDARDEGFATSPEQESQRRIRAAKEERAVYEVPQDFFQSQAEDVTGFEEEK